MWEDDHAAHDRWLRGGHLRHDLLGDQDITDLPPFKRATNTVFQNYALFPHLSVFENIAFGLRRRKTPTDEIRHQVAFMLKLVELPGYEERKPSQLSGGQQQRVALARALVNNPRVLLLDEPLGALDLKLRKQMQVELKRIQSEIGITFIFVTHDQEEAMTMSDRIAVMRAGRSSSSGCPRSSTSGRERVRGRIPRRQQPARRRGGRANGRPRGRPPRRWDGGPRPGAATTAPHGPRGRPAREAARRPWDGLASAAAETNGLDGRSSTPATSA